MSESRPYVRTRSDLLVEIERLRLHLSEAEKALAAMELNDAATTSEQQFSPTADGDPEEYRSVLLSLVEDVVQARLEAERYAAELLDSKAKLKLFIAYAPVSLAMFDRDMRYIAVSRRWVDDYGLTDDEILGRSHYDVFPEIPERWKEVHRRGLAGEVVSSERDGFTRHDGRVQWQRWDVRPWYTGKDAVGGIMIFTEDITERVHIESERQKFVSLAEQSAEFIGMCDMDFMPFFVNKAGVRMVGLDSLEQALRTPVQDFFFPDDRHFVLNEFFPRVLREGRAEVEIRFRHFRTGEALWMSYNVFFLNDENGQPVGLATVSRNITDRKRVDEELRQSRMDLDRAQEVGQIGWWRLDVRNNVLTWSDQNHRIFGVPADTPLTYESFMASVHPDDRAYVDVQWNAALGGAPYDIKHRLLVDGRVKWVREKAYLEFDADGALQGGFGITQDITELESAAVRAQQSETRLRLALRAANAGVWEWDAGADKLLWSPENFALYGLEPRESSLSYADWAVCVHPEDLAATEKAVQDVLAGRAPEFRGEFRVTLPDGRTRWLLGLGRVERAGDGSVLRMLGINLDFTERKVAEDALREDDRRKNDFLATLAHELRNPLAPISNAVEILESSGMEDPVLKQMCDIIGRQTRHMVRLIDDLLDISRITRGKLELRKERVELTAVVAPALEASRSQLKLAGHRLRVSVPNEPIHLECDPVRLTQVLLNLLNNACKFTPKDGVIDLAVEQIAKEVLIRVSDNGIGIASERLPYIFDMFAQFESPVQKMHGGLGIGLALTRMLVEMHGGRIEASSDGVGAGSCFTVRLPVRAEPADSHPIDSSSHAVAVQQTCKRILVVDDHRDIADSLALMLRLAGHDVATAADGLQAIDMAERYRPQVVLLDIGLPGLDGYSTCRRLREPA